MRDFKQYNFALAQLRKQLALAQQRQLVTVVGEQAWCIEFANQLALPNCFVFSNNSALNQQQYPKHNHQILGQEFDHVIFDGFSGLFPEKLAALSGTVKAGGLFILLLPAKSQQANWQDPALASVTSYGHQCHHSYFNQRFFNLLTTSNALTIEQGVSFAPINRPLPENEIDFSEQQHCVKQIVKTAQGRANRPLVISADRGRGKSAALGLAAAQLQDKNIILCTHQSRAIQTSFKHLAHQLNLPFQQPVKQLANVSYFAPDTLLDELPQCDLLFVDEAAAIPVAMLKRMLVHYPRIIFASTIIGYEGNGRGYTLRFLEFLNKEYKNTKHLSLNQPIRFADNDPLENDIRDLLALNDNYHVTEGTHEVSFEQLNSAQLIADEKQLQGIIGLLSLSHYQTSVADLRHLLDAPGQQLFVCKQGENLLGVCQVAIEGNFSEAVAEQVITAQRRPQGHLLAQILAQLSHDTTMLTQLSARVVRIAVAPNKQKQSIGSQLLAYAYQHLSHVSYFGASFGATPELIRFWQKNGFTLVRLGYSKDKATAEHAAIVVKENMQNTGRVAQLQHYFQQDLAVTLFGHFQHISWQLVVAMMASMQSQQVDPLQYKRLTKLLGSDLQIFTAQPIIWRLIWQVPNSLNSVSNETKRLLTRLILQNIPAEQLITEYRLTGKAALHSAFKKAVNEWHQVLTDETKP